MSRRRTRRCTTVLLGGALALTAPPLPAHAAEEVAVPVENPDLADPAVTGTSPATKPPDRWTAVQTLHFPAALAGHPEKLQAASLNQNGPGTLTTRLWRVQKGAKATVTWDDSPSTHGDCKPNELTEGQTYEVTAPGTTGGAPVSFTTKGTPEKGRPAWQSGRSYTFTAGENNPRITLASKQPDKASKCGPLVTRFRAVQEPAPVPYTDKKPRLPMPEAYKLHEPVPPKDVVTACNSAGACRFEKDDRYSFRYYDRPRMVGQAYINCTRNAVTDQRSVRWEEYSYDNITQYFVKAEQKPLTPKREILKESLPQIAAQIEGGFTRADGNPLEMATTNPLAWDRKEDRTLEVTVQPGEVSWIEVQPARERITGTLVKNPDLRLDLTVDVPSGSFGDRFYQRTGPMSKVELSRCADARDNARTPDETIGAPTLRSGGPLAGLVPVDAPTTERPTRSRQLRPADAESGTARR